MKVTHSSSHAFRVTVRFIIIFFLSSRLHSNLYLFGLIVLTKRSEVKLCSVRAFRIIVLISLSTEAKQEQPKKTPPCNSLV